MPHGNAPPLGFYFIAFAAAKPLPLLLGKRELPEAAPAWCEPHGMRWEEGWGRAHKGGVTCRGARADGLHLSGPSLAPVSGRDDPSHVGAPEPGRQNGHHLFKRPPPPVPCRGSSGVRCDWPHPVFGTRRTTASVGTF
ncbi:unnamed protein product [Lota lota]